MSWIGSSIFYAGEIGKGGDPIKKKHKEEINAFLGFGAEFEGKLTFEGAVRVDGKFSGEVQSNGMLIIGEKAFVRAEIQIGILIIRGEVQGTVHAKTRIEAYSPAKIQGDLHSPILVFGEGVAFHGTSHMTEEPEGQTADSIQKTE